MKGKGITKPYFSILFTFVIFNKRYLFKRLQCLRFLTIQRDHHFTSMSRVGSGLHVSSSLPRCLAEGLAVDGRGRQLALSIPISH